jgi:hypothetical protein
MICFCPDQRLADFMQAYCSHFWVISIITTCVSTYLELSKSLRSAGDSRWQPDPGSLKLPGKGTQLRIQNHTTFSIGMLVKDETMKLHLEKGIHAEYGSLPDSVYI